MQYPVEVRVFWDNIHSDVYPDFVETRTREALSVISQHYWGKFPGQVHHTEVSFTHPADVKAFRLHIAGLEAQ